MIQENSKLALIAEQARLEMMEKNGYSEKNLYTQLHPNATQEIDPKDPSNIKGKGTGVLMDSVRGGGHYDIHGRPDIINSGRAGMNSNLFNKTNEYEY